MIVSSYVNLFSNSDFPNHRDYFEQSEKRFNTLKPIKYITEEVLKFSEANFKEKILGVHIRKGDFRKNVGNVSVFIEEIDTFLQKNPTGKVFVSTDDGAKAPYGGITEKENVLERIVSCFGSRIVYYSTRSLNRDSVESVQDALILLLLLRKTDEFLGTKGSSFSDTVMIDRNVPSKFI